MAGYAQMGRHKNGWTQYGCCGGYDTGEAKKPLYIVVQGSTV